VSVGETTSDSFQFGSELGSGLLKVSHLLTLGARSGGWICCRRQMLSRRRRANSRKIL
jgi:hypothetical protein